MTYETADKSIEPNYHLSTEVAEEEFSEIQAIHQEKIDDISAPPLCTHFNSFHHTIQKFISDLPYVKAKKKVSISQEQTRDLCRTFNYFFWGCFYDPKLDIVYHNKIPLLNKVGLNKFYASQEIWHRLPDSELLFKNPNGEKSKTIQNIMQYSILDGASLEQFRSSMQYYLCKNTLCGFPNPHATNIEIHINDVKSWLEEVKVQKRKNMREEFLEFCLVHRDKSRNYLWDFENDTPSSYNWLHKICRCEDSYLTRWLSAHIIYIITGKLLGDACDLRHAKLYQMMLIIRGVGDAGKTSFIDALALGLVGNMNTLLDPKKDDNTKYNEVKNKIILNSDELSKFISMKGDDIKEMLTARSIVTRKLYAQDNSELDINYIYTGTTNKTTFIPFDALLKRFLIVTINVITPENWEEFFKLLPLLYAEAYYYIKTIKKDCGIIEYNNKFDTILTKYAGNKPKGFRSQVDFEPMKAIHGANKYTDSLMKLTNDLASDAIMNKLPYIEVTYEFIIGYLQEHSEDFKVTNQTKNIIEMFMRDMKEYEVCTNSDDDSTYFMKKVDETLDIL